MFIEDNLQTIKETAAKDVILVAVSKTKPIADIKEAYDAGHKIFGENKIQEMVQKYEALPKDIEWHMIGHLQRNKVKYMAHFVSLIHGVDSLKTLTEINKQAIIISIIASFSSTAIWAPIKEPIIAGTASQIPSLNSNTFCFLKLVTPTIFCNKIAIRYVPLATVGGRPITISIGNESAEPPPAIVLINPAATPVTKINPTFNISINISLFFS